MFDRNSRFRSLPLRLRPTDLVSVMVLLAMPFVLTFLQVSWPFNMLAHTDAYYNTGYFIDFPRLVEQAPYIYQRSRLPWILPGYALYQALPHLSANLVLKYVVFYGTVLSFFVTARMHFKVVPAFIVSILLCTDPLFLRWIGSDYASAGILLYSLLMAACLSLYWQLYRSAALLIGAGFFGICVLICHPLAAPIVGILALYHLTYFFRSERQASGLAYPIIGAIGGIASFAAVNAALGLGWDFLAPEVLATIRMSQDLGHYHLTEPQWWLDAPWLNPVAAIFAVSLIIVAVHLKALGQRLIWTILFSILGTAFLLLHFAGFLFLEWEYYTVYAVAFSYFALGEWFALRPGWLLVAPLALTLALGYLRPYCTIPMNNVEAERTFQDVDAFNEKLRKILDGRSPFFINNEEDPQYSFLSTIYSLYLLNGLGVDFSNLEYRIPKRYALIYLSSSSGLSDKMAQIIRARGREPTIEATIEQTLGSGAVVKGWLIGR